MYEHIQHDDTLTYISATYNAQISNTNAQFLFSFTNDLIDVFVEFFFLSRVSLTKHGHTQTRAWKGDGRGIIVMRVQFNRNKSKYIRYVRWLRFRMSMKQTISMASG